MKFPTLLLLICTLTAAALPNGNENQELRKYDIQFLKRSDAPTGDINYQAPAEPSVKPNKDDPQYKGDPKQDDYQEEENHNEYKDGKEPPKECNYNSDNNNNACLTTNGVYPATTITTNDTYPTTIITNDTYPTTIITNDTYPATIITNDTYPTAIITNDTYPTTIITNDTYPATIITNDTYPTTIITNDTYPTTIITNDTYPTNTSQECSQYEGGPNGDCTQYEGEPHHDDPKYEEKPNQDDYQKEEHDNEYNDGKEHQNECNHNGAENDYKNNDACPRPTNDTYPTTKNPISSDGYPSFDNYKQQGNKSATVTIKVTYNGKTHDCSVPKELIVGNPPRCEENDGLHSQPSSNVNSKYCAAIRLQLSKVPGFEAAYNNGVLDSQLITNTGLTASEFNASPKSIYVSIHSSLLLVLGLVSSLFALAL